VEAGAATIIPQNEIDGDRLVAELRLLLDARSRLKAMGAAALTLARPNAASDLARMVVGVAGV
jgi:UDP-N-acetylglucosamine--N-acetylmuramyl-(pentapeptide) pyrophosphoryl-undecaprenol N-acetylglucosamine transferase